MSTFMVPLEPNVAYESAFIFPVVPREQLISHSDITDKLAP